RGRSPIRKTASAMSSASRSTYLGGDISREKDRKKEEIRPARGTADARRLYRTAPANGSVKPLRERCHYLIASNSPVSGSTAGKVPVSSSCSTAALTSPSSGSGAPVVRRRVTS